MKEYKLGDFVEVGFYGEITEIYKQGDKTFYAVEGSQAFARRLSKDQICEPSTEVKDDETK